MYITFYSNDFQPQSDNSSLVIETFSLSKRAYDLNEFTCVCEPIDFNVQPFFAVIRSDKGKDWYYCLAPIVTRTSDNKSQVVARDLKGLLNSECFLPPGHFYGKNQLKNYIDDIFTAWKSTDYYGFNKITFDTSDLANYEAPEAIFAPREAGFYNAFELLKKAMAYYEIYIDTKIDIATQTLTFIVKRNGETIENVHLEDYGIVEFNRSAPAFTIAVASTNDFTIQEKWYLNYDGEITGSGSSEMVLPSCVKSFLADTIDSARVEAILALAEERNQEAIELEVSKNDRLYDIGFDTRIFVYYNKRPYDILPIGQITDNEKGERKITLGYKPVDLVQILQESRNN